MITYLFAHLFTFTKIIELTQLAYEIEQPEEPESSQPSGGSQASFFISWGNVRRTFSSLGIDTPATYP